MAVRGNGILGAASKGVVNPKFAKEKKGPGRPLAGGYWIFGDENRGWGVRGREVQYRGTGSMILKGNTWKGIWVVSDISGARESHPVLSFQDGVGVLTICGSG